MVEKRKGGNPCGASFIGIVGVMSDCLVDSPNERTEPEFGAVEVYFPEAFEHGGDAMVFHYRYNGGCHRGPSMRAVMRFAGNRTSSLHLLPSGKAAAVVTFENIYYALVVSLIESY